MAERQLDVYMNKTKTQCLQQQLSPAHRQNPLPGFSAIKTLHSMSVDGVVKQKREGLLSVIQWLNCFQSLAPTYTVAGDK